ncbi:MAG: tellurite resistance TerB family protein [Cyanobium sp.]
MNSSEAFAAIALAAVACDGALDRAEAHALRQQLEKRSPYRDLSEMTMGQMFDGLLTSLRRDGWETLISEAIPLLTPLQQETGLAMAAELVHADRVVTDTERVMLKRMAAQMQLPAERSQQILDVIALLHRDSLAT